MNRRYTFVALTLYATGCAAHRHPESSSPKQTTPSQQSLESFRISQSPCVQGEIEPETSLASVHDMMTAPEDFVGKVVKVKGVALNLNELSLIADGKNSAIPVSWAEINAEPCRFKEVIAAGVMRRFTKGRFKYVFEVKAIHEKSQMPKSGSEALLACAATTVVANRNWAKSEPSATAVLHPGDTMCLVLEASGAWNSVERVAANEPHIEFNLSVEGQKTVLSARNSTKKILSYQAVMQIQGERDWRQTSSIPVGPGLQNFESWPHLIEALGIFGLEQK